MTANTSTKGWATGLLLKEEAQLGGALHKGHMVSGVAKFDGLKAAFCSGAALYSCDQILK